jgi:predicted metal-binding transcription factor (methanogenesis marker protein 9)
MKNNEYRELVDKLAEEIIEGVMEKEAGISGGKAATVAKGVFNNGKTKVSSLLNAGASTFKGAKNKAIEGTEKVRQIASDKLIDAARRAKDSKAYGVGRGMLGSTKTKVGVGAVSGGASGFGAGYVVGSGNEETKAAAIIGDLIEKVAAHNSISVEDTCEILERVAASYEDAKLRKQAAEEVYAEAEAQEEAVAQVLEELGLPADILDQDIDEEGDVDEEYEEDDETDEDEGEGDEE